MLKKKLLLSIFLFLYMGGGMKAQTKKIDTSNREKLADGIYLDVNPYYQGLFKDAGLDEVEFTKKKFLPTLLAYRQALVDQDIDKVLTFYSKEKFIPDGIFYYKHAKVKVKNEKEFLKVWKQDIQTCLKTDNYEQEKFILSDMRVCSLIDASKHFLKGGDFEILVVPEPVTKTVFDRDMGYSVIVFDKENNSLLKALPFVEEGKEFKIILSYDAVHDIRRRYDPDYVPNGTP
ncbi:hypothetical protein [Leptospira santarosai]|uniref:Uncharacterized protein n=1 Tax=Leptospira santarosai str. MOR084 TaxID=1049984 RepID=A0A0E2BCH0_9LEPT|nr:hypothetical protein [Leptospira santarosai]EKO32979.1 hypothetical protein LEP1GSC179_0106 [Leptospira santarosai str. MOR084]MDI7175102.1 hypothetical protein [Leptospira santarosai]MDI7193822.1 hypothetical protein [Leptospira santarosai]MDI7219428.1 hypothetical protein [Leptospira santarosai]MDO6395918.1 hypothetical protein [Leptospira santarosai]